MKRSMAIAVRMTLLTLVVLGFGYPMAMTGVAAVAFPEMSRGSLVMRDGDVVGSRLIAQGFETDRYFHPRPSVIDYDAMHSGASNLGPTDEALANQVRDRVHAIQIRERIESEGGIPIDAVTSSGSGLDPHISPATAWLQIERVASARDVPYSVVEELVESHLENRQLWVLGEARVNVLELNLDLDRLSSEER